jgi:GntR family transcriptional repressor for pyruvate dehydrogenase complex
LLKASDRNLAMFQPLAVPRRLAEELVARLTADILSGKLAPGARLPTEQEMIAAMGVSRTVVREAVAALKAERLVVTRQGVGAFVAEKVRRPFRIEFDERSPIRDVLDVMELRTGMEIEAAGLAAERATPAQTRKIAECFEAIERAIRKGESGVDEDFAFHCAIAEATGNPQFKRFLEYLGRFIIPRETIRGGPDAKRQRTYADTFQREHRQILQAIRGGAVTQARAAMRRHLMNSRRRYQKLATKLGDQ